MSHEVFVSYSNKDKKITFTILDILEQNEIQCWIAPRDIPPSLDYADSLYKGIVSSSIMLVIFTNHSNLSDHVKREVNIAISNGIPIIPFKIEEVELSPAMNYYLGTTHWLEALTPPLELHILKLVKVIRNLLDILHKTQFQKMGDSQLKSQELLEESINQISKKEISIESFLNLIGFSSMSSQGDNPYRHLNEVFVAPRNYDLIQEILEKEIFS